MTARLEDGTLFISGLRVANKHGLSVEYAAAFLDNYAESLDAKVALEHALHEWDLWEYDAESGNLKHRVTA